MKNTIEKNSINILEQAVLEYVKDPENPETNYRVAIIYEQLGQWAAALSYFLRAAERTKDKDLSYECILKLGLLFDRPRNRGNSVRGQYKQALLINPHRPEAYFLLARHYERERDFVSAYMYACLGEQFADIDAKPLRSWVEYPGRYGLKFEKAVAGWHWGHEKESRRLFRELAEEYHEKMDYPHKTAVYNNIANLGIGREEVTHKHYTPDKYDRLRFKFNGAKNIKITHGQAYQDIFVLSCLNGKRNGTYLEIGSAGPYYGNNTAVLEEEFGWRGVGIDFDEKFVKEYREKRKNPVLQENALEVNYENILSELAVDGVVDYLQLDCEPSSVTYEIMEKIPFDKFKFAVITYEHDHYMDKTKSYRRKSREYLTSRGYKLVVSDVSNEGHSSFEDWYVHPDLIDPNIVEIMTDVIETDRTTNMRTIEDYMLPGPPGNGFDWGLINKNAWFKWYLGNEIFIKKDYERFFKVEEGDIVVDIGASVGPFTYSIVDYKPSKVYCVEPHKELFKTLKKNLSKHNNIEYINIAIGDKDGTFETDGLFKEEDKDTMGRIETVECIKFDTFIKQNNIEKIDFLKIDAEGAEYHVFNDENIEWIKNNVSKIVGEWHTHDADTKAKFAYFRENILTQFESFEVYSADGYDIKKELYQDHFLKYYINFTVYIDNTKKKTLADTTTEITVNANSIQKRNRTKKEYWRRTQWPTLEITTNIAEKGCVVDCVFCPQRILEKSYTDDKRIMTLDEFKFAIDKLPKEVRVTFAGFTEPWLNKYATDMALYAHEQGHPVSAFTTAVGMTPDDVERLSTIPYVGNPNGGFCLHLPDQEEYAKHPINANYIRTIEKFKELQPKFRNFYTMCMSENVHESVKHIFPTASLPTFWNRAGNLLGEAMLKPELDQLKSKWRSAPVSNDPRTCGCIEDLYHNVLLPNGDVSLCCMDYSLDYILGNLYTQDYDDIVPAPYTTYDMCRKCENGVIPKNVQIQL